jgi:hypothetical protein
MRRTIILAVLVLTSNAYCDCRWTDESGDHLWNNGLNWLEGYVPTSDDAFYSTPYYADRSTWGWGDEDPAWLTYENPNHRCVIEEGIDAICKKAKNMRQIYLDITGGSLTVLNEWKIGQDDGPGVIVNMAGGTVNVGTYVHLGGWSANHSMGTLNMTGGAFIVEQDLRMASWDTTESYLNLYGGVVEVGDLIIDGDNGRIDITNGKLIIAADRVADIEWYAARDRITAFAGEGELLYDYDISNPDKTTVSAIPEPATVCLLGLGGLLLAGSRRRKTPSYAAQA